MIKFIEFFTDFRENVKGLVDKGIDYLQLKVDGVDTTIIVNTLSTYIMENIPLPFILKPFKKMIENRIKIIIEERLNEIKDMLLGI